MGGALALSCLLLAGGFLSAVVVDGFWPFVLCWCAGYGAMSWFYPLRAHVQLSRVAKGQAATFLSLDEAIDGIVRAGLALALATALPLIDSNKVWLLAATAIATAGAMYGLAARAAAPNQTNP